MGTLHAMGKAPMPARNVRVPDTVWEAAKKKADHNDENISDVIRRGLEQYISEGTDR